MSKKYLSLCTFLAIILSSFFSIPLMAQMPPHPSLLEKIKSGSMMPPFLMQNLKALRSKGIDAPWSYRDMPGGQLLNKIQDKDQMRNFGPALSPTGSWKALVILVQFSDKPSQVNGTFFDNLLFSANAGSLRDYYKKVSYNNLDIITVNMPSSIGWQNAPQTYAYYCNNQNGTGTYPHNSQKLVEDLISIVNPSIDFSQYDNDHDGYVDALFIVHSGSGAEMTGNSTDIWSHAWNTSSPISVDGVNVFHYSIEPEYWMNAGDMTIGVYAHELGHAAFGLPDLYDRDYTSSGLGSWSLMAGGSWNGVNGNSPSLPDAYCHIQMGFVTPTAVTSNIKGQLIPSIETTPKIFKIWKGGVAGSQYFLVENRQKTSYDQSLINGGLLVYHVDETITTQNDNEWYPNHTSTGHYKVALEQADGNFDLEKNNNSGDVNDPFPGNSNNINFYNLSVPDSKDYSFGATQVGIRNIGPSSSTMTADFEITNTDTSIKVVSPNGGETYKVGSNIYIQWQSGMVSNVKIEFTSDNGTSWSTVSANTPAANGSFNWTAPSNVSSQCKIKITDLANSALFDNSDNVFSIALSGAVAESEPNDTKETANYVSYGDSLSASVNPKGDIDYYKFNASAGDTVEVYAANRNNSTLDGRIQVLDKNGKVLADNDDYKDTRTSRAVCIIPSTDIYYFRYACYNTLSYSPENAAQKSGPQLDYQSGDYYVLLKRFHPSAPQIHEFSLLYSNYNAIRFNASISSNGLATSVKIDYGTSASYGNTLNLSPINSFYPYYIIPLIEGLQPNTIYHSKMTASNAKGTVSTSDLSFVTPVVPEEWTHISANITESLYGIAQWNKNNAIAVGEMGITLTTVNGSDNWTSKHLTSYYSPLLSVCTTDTNSAIAVGYSGGIAKTTDKGSSWRVISTGRSEILYSVSFADNNNGLAVGTGVILKTTNAGENWTAVTYPAALKSLTWLDANTAIAAGTNGVIIKSTDKGSTWNALTSGVSSTLNSVKFFDKNTGLAAGESMILKTADGGNTWTQKNNSGTWRSVVWLDANTAIITGTNGKISKTTDKGENWTNVNSGTNLVLNGISTKDGRTLIVGNYGIILKANETSLFKWKANITVADGNNANSQVLSIGCSPQASQGIDTQLGESSLPPSPPSGAFDARLKLPVVHADYSYADYRSDTLKSIDWFVSYQTGSGGNPITLSWDPASLPEGSFRLKDAITGSLVNVNMKTQSSYTLTNPELLSLKIEYCTQTVSSIQLTKGWNISSVPVAAASMTPSSIFSAADAPVYSFNVSYQTVSTLENGKGYWVRYPSDQTVNVTGAAVGQNTIPVSAGWNLIGVYDNNITVSSITTIPSNIINSPFYGFASGYQVPVTLEAGKGYWIRASQNGTLRIGTASGQPLAKASELAIKKDWGKIIVTDRLDQRGAVYISGDKENLSLYELPPLPPSGVFDVRYSTDRMVENINGSQVFLKISSASYPVIIKSENVDLKIRDIIDGSMVNTILKKGTSLKIENSSLDKLLIEPVGIPLAYELKQNYPNPFNPSTTISFSLPERSHVRLIVYNQLGEMVDEIMNSQMDAGQFTIDWKPERFSSGVYYIQMITDKFSSAKKMLYLK